MKWEKGIEYKLKLLFNKVVCGSVPLFFRLRVDVIVVCEDSLTTWNSPLRRARGMLTAGP